MEMLRADEQEPALAFGRDNDEQAIAREYLAMAMRECECGHVLYHGRCPSCAGER